VSPVIDVDVTGGPEIVPPAAGRFLYYWDVGGAGSGTIMRLPLQGVTNPVAYWNGNGMCVGCHSVSPDGRYLAVVNSGSFTLAIVDTMSNQLVTVPGNLNSQNTVMVAWRPDVNAAPPYQFAYDDGQIIRVASVMGGPIGTLAGADIANVAQKHPAWGPNGKIAFVRGTNNTFLGFSGSSDIMLIDENGGMAQPLVGASGTGGLNYYPAFSPNGEWIAYTISHGGGNMGTYAAQDAEIRVVASNQSGTVLNPPMLNSPGFPSSFPTWSHDGQFLSFSSERTGGLGSWDIWFVAFDPVTGNMGMPMDLMPANTSGFEHLAQWSL
jgi:Tol biopolymer transport system component